MNALKIFQLTKELSMYVLFHLLVYLLYVKCETLNLNLTRRILRGNEAHDTRPYMVYLRPTSRSDQTVKELNWLCGGAIIHPLHILTSAACIEDIQQFFVISGTHRWSPIGEDDECIKNGAKKAVWKCVPKGYVFDGRSYDNMRWMIKDIAVVKVDSEFNFERKVRGCDFIPKMIAFNNQSRDLEAAGKVASIAGWGSTEYFGHYPQRSTMNSPELLETEVLLLSKRNCKRRWPQRYHYIIDQEMICGKDGVGMDTMSSACKGTEVDCKELIYSDEEDYTLRRSLPDLENLEVHSASHFNNRRTRVSSGGFCENDHGGPLVLGYGNSAVVIGVISACMTTNVTHRCIGPFLYTSVYNNRHVISCAIDMDKETACRKAMDSEGTYLTRTYFQWKNKDEGVPSPRAKSTVYVSTTTKRS